MATAAERRHLDAMHATYGVTPGQVCKDCAYCPAMQAGNPTRGTVSTRVCRKAQPHIGAHGKVSYRRWLIRWPACGLFVAKEA